jgi:hypothetical protein
LDAIAAAAANELISADTPPAAAAAAEYCWLIRRHAAAAFALSFRLSCRIFHSAASACHSRRQIAMRRLRQRAASCLMPVTAMLAFASASAAAISLYAFAISADAAEALPD